MHVANLNSTRKGFAAGSPSTALRATVLNLTPVLFAALLVGCATKAQTRSASQPTPQTQAAQTPAAESTAKPAYEPAAYEDPVVSSPHAEETAAAPEAVKDEGGVQSSEEGEAQPEVFGQEAAETKPEEEPEPQQFTEQAAPVAEEEPSDQQAFADDQPTAPDEEAAPQQFADDDTPAMDEDVAQQQFTDDAATAKDEEVIAQRQFTDDEAPAEDEVVAQQQFMDEPPAAKDEDIVAQQQFRDDAGTAAEDVTAPEVFKDDTAEAAPEELAREPETFTEEKVAQTEEPKAAPATMLPVTVTVEADPLFDFDQYSIRADSRRKLDELIQQLQGVTYGEIIAVGFADPIGTAKYNKGLSERRAASVKRYLVNKGIPADRVKTEGRGKTEEFASYKDCRGQRKQKLIACLEPNRRVEVTVTAEKQQ